MVARGVLKTVSRSAIFPACGAVSEANTARRLLRRAPEPAVQRNPQGRGSLSSFASALIAATLSSRCQLVCVLKSFRYFVPIRRAIQINADPTARPGVRRNEIALR